MNLTFASALLIVWAPVLAENASAASITYGSVGIIRGYEIDDRYISARDACMLEASTPPRGNRRTDNFYNQASLRACLYRHGFSSKGDYVYPVPLFGSPARIF